MGGDLHDVPRGQAPKFMIPALRDPDGANLDRVQIIKGWLDGNGETTNASTMSPFRTAAKSGAMAAPANP